MKLGKYVQLFPPPVDPENINDDLLGALPGHLKQHVDITDSALDAGYTYFGQFIDHDLSFMQQTDLLPGGTRQTLDDLANRRLPSLDLDSIYGAGLEDSAVPFDHTCGKFVIGKTLESNQPRDLPRGKRFQAMIADPRNDENLLVAQMQVLFMNLHNKIIDRLGLADPAAALAAARLEVVQLYQHVVLHDFARQLLPSVIYCEMIEKPLRFSKPSRGSLQSLRGQRTDALALEFATAAFRLHGLVRNFYFVGSEQAPQTSLATLLTYQLDDTHQEKNKLQDRFVVDWRLFFRDVHATGRSVQRARRISPRVGFDVPAFITTASQWSGNKQALEQGKDSELIYHLKYNQHQTLQDLPTGKGVLEQAQERPFDLANRTLQRGREFCVASAQQVIGILQDAYPDDSRDFGLTEYIPCFVPLLYEDSTWVKHTPLWLYCMLEAWECNQGNRLGKLGGWIVADTLLTAAASTRLPLDPGWDVTKSPVYTSLEASGRLQSTEGMLNLRDLVEYTYSGIHA